MESVCEMMIDSSTCDIVDCRTYTTTIMGPWKEMVNPLKIIDVSISPGIDFEDEKSYLVLAVTKKNNLFMRKGVTVRNPAVRLYSLALSYLVAIYQGFHLVTDQDRDENVVDIHQRKWLRLGDLHLRVFMASEAG